MAGIHWVTRGMVGALVAVAGAVGGSAAPVSAQEHTLLLEGGYGTSAGALRGFRTTQGRLEGGPYVGLRLEFTPDPLPRLYLNGRMDRRVDMEVSNCEGACAPLGSMQGTVYSLTGGTRLGTPAPVDLLLGFGLQTYGGAYTDNCLVGYPDGPCAGYGSVADGTAVGAEVGLSFALPNDRVQLELRDFIVRRQGDGEGGLSHRFRLGFAFGLF